MFLLLIITMLLLFAIGNVCMLFFMLFFLTANVARSLANMLAHVNVKRSLFFLHLERTKCVYIAMAIVYCHLP